MATKNTAKKAPKQRKDLSVIANVRRNGNKYDEIIIKKDKIIVKKIPAVIFTHEETKILLDVIDKVENEARVSKAS